jgi:hypothetical protein
MMQIFSSNAGGAEAKVEFVRIDEDPAAVRLQTAITRYEKDGVTVDLIGSIHIADKGYFVDLDRRFVSYEALLFEMVGGEKYGRKQPANGTPTSQAGPVAGVPKPEKAPNEAGKSSLREMYKMFATSLGLASQQEEIDYNQPNFVHADLTDAEFLKMQAERGETVQEFALGKPAKSSKAAKDRKPANTPSDNDKMRKAMLSGDTNLMKLQMVYSLGQDNNQIGAIAGGSFIVASRNVRCLEVLEREIKAGTKNLGVLYGTDHFSDLTKRLEEKGFKRIKQEWLTAWDVPKPQQQVNPEPGPPTGEEQKKAA